MERWSGWEARKLREAYRLSVRDFAAHLGMHHTSVSAWEARGRDTRLRPETQQILDAALEHASDEVRVRFQLLVGSGPGAGSALGRRSTARTAALLAALRAGTATTYDPPEDALPRLREFLASSARAYLVTGPAGGGKTHLSRWLAEAITGHVDVQLMSAESWERPGPDLATEILRYGSVPAAEDPLLTLETEAAALQRPCLVVIDGINSQEQFAPVGRQIDAILRQVTSPGLRFALIVRTPPELETAAFPVLHTGQFTQPGSRSPAAPYVVAARSAEQARRVWEGCRSDSSPHFDQLPAVVQDLTRLPLYMQLALAAGDAISGQQATAYAVLDHCVRAVLRRHSAHPGLVFAALADLAQHQSPDLIPAVLHAESELSHRPAPASLAASSTPGLVRTTATADVEFDHDVLREYFLATRIVELLCSQRRPATTVTALNDLAAACATSATARTVFALTVSCLDSHDRAMLTAAALAPTVSVSTTLPLMLTLAEHAAFLTPQVLQASAQRCRHDGALPLARALMSVRGAYHRLGPDRASWMVDMLRRFGAAVWTEAAGVLEHELDAADVRELLAAADLSGGEEAAFFARHAPLILGDTSEAEVPLHQLLAHPNWRVRAALAEGLDAYPHHHTTQTGRAILDALLRDRDYKVRAFLAATLRTATGPGTRSVVRAVLTDDNWHVRDRALQGLLARTPRSPGDDDVITAGLDITGSDPTWDRPPHNVQTALHRLGLLHRGTEGPHTPGVAPSAADNALFTLLRQIRTHTIYLPGDRREQLIQRGQRSGHWLVRREADALAHSPGPGPPPGEDPRMWRESFRRRRGHRAIQVALDVQDLDRALWIAQSAVATGIDVIEVGDPLIKHVGLRAIEHLKQQLPATTIVAEMMSADWGRDQVVLAAQAGADVVLLIGPASTASVSAATDAARPLGVPVMLDAPADRLSHAWVTEMERAGVDGFTLTTNIDVGTGSRGPLLRARELRSWTRLPVAVSGGFSPTDDVFAHGRDDWDILIVGRAVTDAVDPAAAALRIAELVHANSEGAS